MKTTLTLCVPDLATFVSLFVALASVPTVSGQTKGNSEVQIPLIQFQNIPLDTAIANLAQQAELNYILSPKIPNRAVSVRLENVSARSALTNLLAEHKLFLVENPATTVAHVATTNRIESPVDAKWIAADTNAVIPLIQFQSAPLDIALENLTRRAAGIVLDPKLAGSSLAPGQPPALSPDVSVRWKNLKPRQAIAALCENYNLVLVKDPATGGIRITPK